MSRIKHNLWKVSNGWLLVPEGVDGMLPATEAGSCMVFKDLNEFAKYTPKRIRKPRKKKEPCQSASV